ncbi:MAG: cysteine-rich small domain-containing protein [Bacteroidales bacterium]|nr:cysteine-rich small domain-containing protein [Clostridium sp.]MCM1204016.1 cysteine-rich small domain-containing protein [Bacteroidales bacterium]
MKEQDWKGKHFSFFSNRECEYFPCHQGADSENFNCLFCYCPLYPLGKDCGGNPVFLENGIKDCSQCRLPHKPENYGQVMERLAQTVKRTPEQ